MPITLLDQKKQPNKELSNAEFPEKGKEVKSEVKTSVDPKSSPEKEKNPTTNTSTRAKVEPPLEAGKSETKKDSEKLPAVPSTPATVTTTSKDISDLSTADLPNNNNTDHSPDEHKSSSSYFSEMSKDKEIEIDRKVEVRNENRSILVHDILPNTPTEKTPPSSVFVSTPENIPTSNHVTESKTQKDTTVTLSSEAIKVVLTPNSQTSIPTHELKQENQSKLNVLTTASPITDPVKTEVRSDQNQKEASTAKPLTTEKQNIIPDESRGINKGKIESHISDVKENVKGVDSAKENKESTKFEKSAHEAQKNKPDSEILKNTRQVDNFETSITKQRNPSLTVTVERLLQIPHIPIVQRSIDWVTRVIAGEKIASPSPAIAPLLRLKEIALETHVKPLLKTLSDSTPKIKEVLSQTSPSKQNRSSKEKLSSASKQYRELKEVIKAIEGKVLQNIQRELQPHIKELVKADASPIDPQKLKQLIILKDLFNSSCEKAKLVVEQSLSVIKTLQSEIKNIPQEVFESFKSLLQDLIRSALPLSTDPESLDPEQIARLMTKIRGLLSQLRDQAIACGEDLSYLDDLLDLIEEMELLEQIEIELLEELLALEEARDVETLLEQEEALAEIEAIIRRDAYKKLLEEQQKEDEVVEVFSLLVKVVDENDLPQQGILVYGGQLGVYSTNDFGEVKFENIEPETFVIIGLDPDLGISKPDSFSMSITQHESVQFKIFR